MSASIQMFAPPSDAKSGAKTPAGFADLFPAQSADTRSSNAHKLAMSFADEMDQSTSNAANLGDVEQILPDDIHAFLSGDNLSPRTEAMSELAIKTGDLNAFHTIKLDVSDDVAGQDGEITLQSQLNGPSANTQTLDVSFTGLAMADAANLETLPESLPQPKSPTIPSNLAGETSKTIVPSSIPAEAALSEPSLEGVQIATSDQAKPNESNPDSVLTRLTDTPVEPADQVDVATPEMSSGSPVAAVASEKGLPALTPVQASAQSEDLVQAQQQKQTASLATGQAQLQSERQVQSQAQPQNQTVAQPTSQTANIPVTSQSDASPEPHKTQNSEPEPDRLIEPIPAKHAAPQAEAISKGSATPKALPDMDFRMGDAPIGSNAMTASNDGPSGPKTLPASLPAAPIPAVTSLAGMGERLAASILQTAQSQAPVTLDKIPQAVVAIAMTSRSATLQIDPPELGRIQLDYQFDSQGRTVVTLVPESEAARAALTDRMASILASLEQSASGEIDVQIGDARDFNANQNMEAGHEDEFGLDQAGSTDPSDPSTNGPTIDLRQFIRPAPGQDGRLHIRV